MSEVAQLPEGIHEHVSPDVYHAQDSYSRGDIVMAEVPAKMRWTKDHPEEDGRTPAKDFGEALHTLLLEPAQFETRHVINTKYENFKTNEAKNWRDEIHSKGGTILSTEERDSLTQMVQNAREHPEFSRIFRSPGTRRELTMVARHPATGLLLRCRIDILPPGYAIPDIKTCIDASPDGFGKAVWNMHYGSQAAHYLLVHNLVAEKKRDEFIYFCLEKTPPYLCALYIVPHDLIAYCAEIEKQRLYVIAQCEKTGIWPGYPWHSDMWKNEFSLPGYARHEIEQVVTR